MKTVFNKIGHQKVSVDSIRAKEMEILRKLEFMIGSSPTPLEFLQNYIEKLFGTH